MVSVFLAPGRAEHVKKAVVNGVEIQTLKVRDERLWKEIHGHYPGGRVYLWGLSRVGRNEFWWGKVRHGDYLLFYIVGMAGAKRFAYCSRVLFTYPFNPGSKNELDEAERIAEAIWGRDEKGKTWPLLIFLDRAKAVNLGPEDIGLRFPVQFFYRAREDIAKKVLELIERT